MDSIEPEADQDCDCLDTPPSSAASDDAEGICDADLSFTRLQGAVRLLLEGIGEDIDREGLRETPKRVAKAWIEATEGYRQSVHSVLGGALFHEDISSTSASSMVLVQDVEFASTSEHTLLPFYGRCHLAYAPRSGVVLGLSKVARLAKMFARRLQNQQRFTEQLLEAFAAEVQPLGCAAIVEACHMGAEKREVRTTAAALGCFHEKQAIFMQEFVGLMGRPDLSLPAAALQATANGYSHCPATRSGSGSGMRSANSLPVSMPQLTRDAGVIAHQREEGMKAAVATILQEVGENPARKGLEGSVQRYVKHLLASASGMAQCLPESHLTRSPPTDSSCSAQRRWRDAPVDELDLAFTSQCEHHLLPFHGAVQILCVPGPSGAHLSHSLAEQVTRAFSRRLQIQERLTHQIASALHSSLQPAGTLVLCQAAHMCMVARGVEKHASSTVTMAAYGIFETDHTLRAQALQRLHRQRTWRTAGPAEDLITQH